MEWQYIRQILEGDHGRFAYFVETYQDMAYSVAFSVLHEEADAQDAVQDAFLKAYRSLHQFRQDAKFSTWFYRIVVNTALSRVKQHKTAREMPVEELPEDRIATTEAAYGSLAQAEQRRFIDLAMAKLNPEDRLILTLYYLREHSLEEVAEMTGIVPENLKMKLHRARKKMYTALHALLQSETNQML